MNKNRNKNLSLTKISSIFSIYIYLSPNFQTMTDLITRYVYIFVLD